MIFLKLKEVQEALEVVVYFSINFEVRDREALLSVAESFGQTVVPLDSQLRGDLYLIDAGRLEHNADFPDSPASVLFHHEDLCCPLVPHLVLIYVVSGQNARITLRDVTIAKDCAIAELLVLAITSRCSNYRPGSSLDGMISNHQAVMRSPMSGKYALMVDNVFTDKPNGNSTLYLELIHESPLDDDIYVELAAGSLFVFDNYRFVHKSKLYTEGEYLEYWKAHVLTGDGR